MNIFLWIMQGLLALHTAIGAVWKFSNSEQSMGSLSAIPHGIWTSMSLIELICSAALLIPAFYKPMALLAPIAALIVAIEMLGFSAVHLSSGDSNGSPLIYWGVVAVICIFIGYGRFYLSPLKQNTSEKAESTGKLVGRQ